MFKNLVNIQAKLVVMRWLSVCLLFHTNSLASYSEIVQTRPFKVEYILLRQIWKISH